MEEFEASDIVVQTRENEIPRLKHSCTPSTYKGVGEQGDVVYRACQTQPLENASYCAVDPLQCNLWRREGLKTKGIDCDCERCSDGSEAGTGFGSLACTCGGLVSPCSPGVPWKCPDCGSEREESECIELLETLRKKLEEGADDLQVLLDAADRKREWSQLAPNNQLVAEAMRALLFIFQYYNKYPGFEGDKFDMLDNKVWYCEELLSLYSKLWPGRNYPAVMVEYEQLHATLPLLELQAEDGATREELEMSLDNLMEVGLGAKDMLAREPDLTLYRQLSQFTLQVVEWKQSLTKGVIMYKPGQHLPDAQTDQVTQIKGIPQMESGVPVLAEKVTANITAPVFKMGSHRP